MINIFKLKIISIILFFLLSVNMIIFFPLINIKNSSHFFYREIMYIKIIDDLKLEDNLKTLLNAFEYIYFNIDDAYSASFEVLDENSFVDLIRGFAFCDQQSFILMNLLNKLGFNSRLRDVYKHTYSEFNLNNKWIIVDPYYGYIFLDKDNNFLDFQQIQSLNIDDISDYLKLTNLNIKNNNLLNFKKIYQPNNGRWPDSVSPIFKDYRKYDLVRKFYEAYSIFIFKIFGNIYFNFYQDLYLNIYKSKSLVNNYSSWVPKNVNIKNNNFFDQSFELFYIARNYELSNRHKKSMYLYEKNIFDYPETFWTKESYYFLAQIFYRNKNYNKTIELLKHIENDHQRSSKINYYLGMSYYYLKNIKKAKEYLGKSNFLYSNVILNKLS